MSHKVTVGIAALAALGCAAGAIYWMHVRGEQSQPNVAAAVSSGFHETPAAENPPVAAAERASSSASEKKSVAPPDAGLSLRPGEVLEYTANVAKLTNVANLRLQVAGRGSFLGKNAWHLQAFAHTENPLRMVFTLDDEFDSYSDAGSLASLQYEMHLNERGQKVESVQRMTSTGKEPAPPDATAARVSPGTRDPLGMMEYLRSVDWEKTSEVRSPVYDGHKLYAVHAKLAERATNVTVPAGVYTASQINIRVFDNGAEMKDASFVFYLANDAVRTPVLLEATMPFATARVELLKAK
jgi:hypothetical protein